MRHETVSGPSGNTRTEQRKANSWRDALNTDRTGGIAGLKLEGSRCSRHEKFIAEIDGKQGDGIGADSHTNADPRPIYHVGKDSTKKSTRRSERPKKIRVQPNEASVI